MQQIAKRWVSDRRPVRYDGVWYIDVETAGENPWNVFLDENGVWYLGWQAQQPISLPFTFVSENHLHTMLDDEGHLEPREVAVQMTNGDSIGLVFFDDKLVTSYGGVPLKDAIRNGVERMFRA
ncbi:hypothetical protein SAMN06295885_1288 [Rathayibacter oskolensis]|uniref:Uncharacterized protein n=1 Tax=Rathayibacter oskolensis TaxID=1891671 RepID=A0A1X7NHN4_9MICO|nr:hypothetical protein SAMN06295885_1288 [Rathayibacter oskolensis]